MESKKKATISLITVFTLTILLVFTTFALNPKKFLVVSSFQTGYVKLDFNNGQKIFNNNNLRLAPGEEISESMTITNTGTTSEYYQIYLKNVSGPLSDSVVLNIFQGNNIIKSVYLHDFTQSNALESADPLEINESKTFLVRAIFLDESGNLNQNGYVNFDFVADAVQFKNNKNKMFN